MSEGFLVTRFGGPEALEWTTLDPGSPGPGEVRVRHTAVGVNYIDVYQRSGVYQVALPFTPGNEAAGVVEALGEGVRDLAVGDRVAYAGNVGPGAYRQARIVPAVRLVTLPGAITDIEAAGVLLKGRTVEYLVRRIAGVKARDQVLLQAAAGGVGLIAAQWLSHLGATVIGTAGSREKAELARAHGCDHVVLYREESVWARVKELTAGRGVDVVLDGVGRDTFEESLDSLRPRGLMITFGNASGVVPPVAPIELAKRGSLALVRPRLGDYYADPEEAREGTEALFDVVLSGAVRVPVTDERPLRRAAEAHRDLEARTTTGSIVLTV